MVSKRDENDNEALILNKMVTSHKNGTKSHQTKVAKVSRNWHQNSN